MATWTDRNIDLDRQPVPRKWRDRAKRKFLLTQDWRIFRIVVYNIQFKVAVQMICSVFKAFGKYQTHTNALELGGFQWGTKQSKGKGQSFLFFNFLKDLKEREKDRDRERESGGKGQRDRGTVFKVTPCWAQDPMPSPLPTTHNPGDYNLNWTQESDA